ncbi:hypothetical protein P691DRAFT_767626 [Macrolepiota fuliginosa MF-IS2]|uniref:Ribonuclease H1 N-terminal domain-containing protein n=1 Tax=Macrolepiota fuliginosa MF-IS2 TaxID=1400762 RepID=A0A9P5WXZ4_9AGAR|nr:hypothetical protein P691DRAFT_767626 [Macrolepiota fuliginosa MF-IS2]
MTPDNHCLGGFSDSAPVYPVSPRLVKELSKHDREALTAREWEKPHIIMTSDTGETMSDTDTTTNGDVISIIATYVVYYGCKMGIFREWVEVEKYMKGFRPGNYECFSSVPAAWQAWSNTLTKRAWGLPELMVHTDENNGDEKDDSEPLITPM